MSKKKRKAEVVLAESETQAMPTQLKRKWQNIWWVGVALSLAGTLIILLRYANIYGVQSEEPSVTNLGNIEVCPRYNYVLYRDLYNAVNGGYYSFGQIYGASGEEDSELTLSDYMIARGRELLGYDVDNETIRLFWDSLMQDMLGNVRRRLEHILNSLSESMPNDMDFLDYWIQDQETGTIVTNTLQTEKGQEFSVEEYVVWFQMSYDAAGQPSVNGAADRNINKLTKTLYDSARKGLYDNYMGEAGLEYYLPELLDGYPDYSMDDIRDIITQDSLFVSQLEQRIRSFGGPRNCTIYYGIKKNQWLTLVDNYHARNDFDDIYQRYNTDGLKAIYLAIVGLLWAGGIVYGRSKRFFRAPAEAVAVGTFILLELSNKIAVWATRLYMNNNPYYYLHTVGTWTWGDLLLYGKNLLGIACLFFAAWYLGCCVAEAFQLGIRRYLRKRMICFRAWDWCKERISRYYRTLVNLDITKDSRRQVIKLLIINGIVVLLLCTMWVAGWFGVIMYSLLLYVVIKKYMSDLQKKYSILLRATNEIANGNLEVRITEHLGVFEPFKPQIYRIEEGFQKAVAEEVKSQRMKTELITNVSHDLKTPLTAIITYVNLLKEDNVTEEQRTQYLQILEQKSLRLKALIEDLFEVSKANSKNVTLNLVDVDIVNLLRQVEFEQEDRLEERNLAVRLRLPEEKVMVRLDSQKAYRIYENLFGNIIKYAMEGTRIYVDLERSEEEVTVRLKNITEQEITVSGEELTERFVRGDASRGTEGSGLGLAIVRSFTELMGGRFEVTVDGDLFTASTTWALERNQLSL
ncbi:MAG: HAMP domain-containing histidine kinase [bacterium]|nr:HAMP domain-containing histidine kinase [bacterium]MCM1375693.1 HAMP domain-containing histidine kinase [Muribaculum sp.]